MIVASASAVVWALGLLPTMLSPETQPDVPLVAAGAALGAVAVFIAAIPFIMGGRADAT